MKTRFVVTSAAAALSVTALLGTGVFAQNKMTPKHLPGAPATPAAPPAHAAIPAHLSHPAAMPAAPASPIAKMAVRKHLLVKSRAAAPVYVDKTCRTYYTAKQAKRLHHRDAMGHPLVRMASASSGYTRASRVTHHGHSAKMHKTTHKIAKK